jgi:hypothetical protein
MVCGRSRRLTLDDAPRVTGLDASVYPERPSVQRACSPISVLFIRQYVRETRISWTRLMPSRCDASVSSQALRHALAPAAAHGDPSR